MGEELETGVFWARLTLTFTGRYRSAFLAGNSALPEEWQGVREGGSSKPTLPSPVYKAVKSTMGLQPS